MNKFKQTIVKVLSILLIKMLDKYSDNSCGVNSIYIYYDYTHVQNREINVQVSNLELVLKTNSKNQKYTGK